MKPNRLTRLSKCVDSLVQVGSAHVREIRWFMPRVVPTWDGRAKVE